MLEVGGSIPSPPTNPLLQLNYSDFYTTFALSTGTLHVIRK
jgi:hypothetical protein